MALFFPWNKFSEWNHHLSRLIFGRGNFFWWWNTTWTDSSAIFRKWGQIDFGRILIYSDKKTLLFLLSNSCKKYCNAENRHLHSESESDTILDKWTLYSMQIFEKITKGDFQFLKSKFVCIFICNFAKNVQKNEWLFLTRGIL